MGRLDEALRESQAAWALDPISPYAIVGVGKRYYFLRQYDSAITWLRKALDLDPHFNLTPGPLLHAYVVKGDISGARQFLENARSIWTQRLLDRLWPLIYAAEGNGAEARKGISGLTDIGVACHVAGVYVALGDQREAISWLDRAVEGRSACFPTIPVEPLFDGLHSNPDFAALLRKMKIKASH
jgi:tetratricopeptide (TPR) repeat protein